MTTNTLNGAAAPAGNFPTLLSVNESRTVYRALNLLRRKLTDRPVVLTNPQAVRDYLTLELATEEREVFMCLWLDTQNRLIAAEKLFFGTINQTSVWPRECARSALRHNAAAVIIAHNHPSGRLDPSPADLDLTSQLADAFRVIDVRLLDHFIVGHSQVVSLAEQGRVPGTAIPVLPAPTPPAKRQRTARGRAAA